jgi:hypothetical protein
MQAITLAAPPQTRQVFTSILSTIQRNADYQSEVCTEPRSGDSEAIPQIYTLCVNHVSGTVCKLCVEELKGPSFGDPLTVKFVPNRA